VSEAALRPAQFVVVSTWTHRGALTDIRVRLAPTVRASAGRGRDGVALRWPRAGTISARRAGGGEHLARGCRGRGGAAEFEGVLTIFSRAGGECHRLDFMRCPKGRRSASSAGRAAGPGAASLLPIRSPGRRQPTPEPGGVARDRRSPARARHGPAIRALAEGGTELDSWAVKFIVDMEAGRRRAPSCPRAPGTLHYTWIRERIQCQPHLEPLRADRGAAFRPAGASSRTRSTSTTDEAGDFLLGTLVRTAARQCRRWSSIARRHHAASRCGGLLRGGGRTRAIRALGPCAPRAAPGAGPEGWRAPAGARANAPFADRLPAASPRRGLSASCASCRASELRAARPGSGRHRRDDDVPNDVPLIGGLITRPSRPALAHRVLTRNRGTPDMAL
jgi:hypothetical protein